MKLKHVFGSLALISFLGISPMASADGDHGQAVKTMAEIVSHLKHFPSADEKANLRKIADSSSSSPEEQALATALMNMQHSVSGPDRKRLQKIADNPSASKDAKALAHILLRLNHMPSNEDKEVLADMLH